MTNHLLKSAAISALLLGFASSMAFAIDASVTGTPGGLTAAVSGAPAPATASVTLGGGGGNIANGGAGGPGNNGASFSIGSGGGPLASVGSNGNPAGGGSASQANVNLGILSGLLTGGGIGDGGGVNGNGNGGGVGGKRITNASVGNAISGMSSSQKASLKKTCRSVMSSPGDFDVKLTKLCQVLAKL